MECIPDSMHTSQNAVSGPSSGGSPRWRQTSMWIFMDFYGPIRLCRHSSQQNLSEVSVCQKPLKIRRDRMELRIASVTSERYRAAQGARGRAALDRAVLHLGPRETRGRR